MRILTINELRNLQRCPNSSQLKGTDSFTSITDEAVEELVTYQLNYIDLSGLIDINKTVATCLGQTRCDLDLSGLSSLSPILSENLANHIGHLDLRNITSLTSKAIEHLSKHQGGINLQRLNSLSETDAIILSRSQGGLDLHCAGIAGLSEKSLHALAKHNGFLDLGINTLSDESAKLFSLHKGGHISLERLHDISIIGLHYLAKHEDIVSISPFPKRHRETLSILKEFERTKTTIRFDDGICVLKQYMSFWLGIGISQSFHLEFSGFSDDGTVETPYISQQTSNLLNEHGYAFGWLDSNLMNLDTVRHLAFEPYIKTGLRGLVWRILTPGFEVDSGTSGSVTLDTRSGLIKVYYRKYFDLEEPLFHEWREVF